MERIKTYTSFNDKKPEIEKLNKAGQVHETELKTEEEIDNEDTAEDFLQNSVDNSEVTEVQVDENVIILDTQSDETFKHLKHYLGFNLGR